MVSHEEKREQLKQDFASEMARFDQASQRAAKSIRENLNVSRWVQQYPLETALFTIASAVILAKTIRGAPKTLSGDTTTIRSENALKRPPPRSI